jgi:hypothetical protein
VARWPWGLAYRATWSICVPVSATGPVVASRGTAGPVVGGARARAERQRRPDQGSLALLVLATARYRLRGLLAHEGAGAGRAQHVVLVAGRRGHGVGADRRVRLGRQIEGPLLGGLIPHEAVARGRPAGRIDHQQLLELAATDARRVADGDGRGGDVVGAEGEVVLVEERQPQRDDALIPLAEAERCIEGCGETVAGGRERGVRNSRRVSEPDILNWEPSTNTCLKKNAASSSSVRGKATLVNGPPGG